MISATVRHEFKEWQEEGCSVKLAATEKLRRLKIKGRGQLDLTMKKLLELFERKKYAE